MKLLFKLKKLLGLSVDMVIIFYMKDLKLVTEMERDNIYYQLTKKFKTLNILVVEGSENKIDIQYF